MAKQTKNEAAFQALVEKYGKANIARMAGTSRQSITKWGAVPTSRVTAIAAASGIPPEQIRPEPYAKP